MQFVFVLARRPVERLWVCFEKGEQVSFNVIFCGLGKDAILHEFLFGSDPIFPPFLL